MVNSLSGSSGSIGVPITHDQAVSLPLASQQGKSAGFVGHAGSAPQEITVLSSPGLGRYAELQGQRDASNEAAQAVHAADAAMGEISDALGGIKQALTQIVKQYPPYALDSNERTEYLNRIAGLRKQIEALSRLPGGGQDAFAVSVPSVEPIVVGVQFGEMSPSKLGIPALGQRASDEAVQTALGKVHDAAERVNQIRATFAGAVHAATEVPDQAVEKILSALR